MCFHHAGPLHQFKSCNRHHPKPRQADWSRTTNMFLKPALQKTPCAHPSEAVLRFLSLFAGRAPPDFDDASVVSHFAWHLGRLMKP